MSFEKSWTTAGQTLGKVGCWTFSNEWHKEKRGYFIPSVFFFMGLVGEPMGVH